MAVANMSELPDLDSLLNAAESQSCSIHSSLEEKGTFDPNEFAGVVKWYNEQSKTYQLHYDQHLEHQKRKLAKENEDSLLEALQQSLQNFESDHVISDFANLSSSLGRDGEFDKSCMLKEILLSPFSDRYSREVNSPEHVNKDIVEYGNSSPCPPGQHDSNFMKPKATKRLNHFSELRKHMEATSVDSQRESSHNVSKLGGTRLVSSRQYISKYGAASAIDFPQVTMSAEEVETMPQRVLVHPVAVAGKSGSKRKTLTLALKSSTAAKILDGKSKVMIQNPTSGPAKAVGVASIVTTKADGDVPATVKRSHSSGDQIPSKKMCMNMSSGDHDYCTEQSISTSVENPCSERTGTDDLSGTEKPNQKVVKWHEYLRQCREGVRSASNSPSSSPRVAKGSGRQSNNFMVVSLHNGHTPAKVLVNSVAGKDKSQTVVPLPLPLKKNTVKTQFELQEFNKYITDLKDNLNSPKVTLAVPESETQSIDIPAGKPISASQSLAAIAQQHKRKSLENGNANDVKVHTNLSRSISDGSSSVNVNKDKHTSKGGAVPGRSGQLLMIKVPVSSSCKSAKTLTCSSVISSIGSTVTNTTTTSKLKTDFQTTNNLRKVNEKPPIGKVDEKRDDNQSMSSKVLESPAKGSNKTTKPGSSPTFKLMACNKDGVEGKSLILSGVSGTLKDILTKLAEQQAKSKAEGKSKGIDNDEQQISILQKLISCVTSNKDETQTKAESHNVDATQVTSNTNALHSTLTNRHHTCSTPQNSMPQAHSQMSEPAMDQTMRICGVSNGTAAVSISSQAKNCYVSPVQCINTSPVLADQSFAPDLINGETLSENTKTNVCSISGNHAHDNATLKVDPTGDILASAMSKVCNAEATYLLEGSDHLVSLTGENIASSKSGENELGQSINNVTANDYDPAVITLEDALMELNNEDVINNSTSQSGEVNFPSDENLFCKLPSYYLNGKVMKEGPQEDMANLMSLGMKQESCDPLISVKAEDDLEFNKLPHYFSSGKPSHDRSISTDETASKKRDKEYAVKLNPVGEGQHLTPQGAPVDTTQTYYSRLPSYYSYGRPHPPVKTFNDEAADAKDDTVTPETLESDSRREKRKKKKKLKKRKKKKKSKHDDNVIVDEVSEKILYSKLPSYYMSSKVVKRPGRSGRLQSPTKSSGTRSPSPFSLSYCSRSSRSRSRSYSSSPSRERRYRSRSYSRSPYSSDSDSESRRSWRRERPSRSGRGMDRRSCKSTDEELEDFRWHREREVRKSRRQNHVKQEKDNQEAMEERRVVYVGGIEEKMTKQDLRNKFLKFGNIISVSLFFRNDRDNYGFLTFQYTCDAFRAIEQGADLAPNGSRYDLCFGGRRQFCKSRYEDLDSRVPRAKAEDADDFDALLQRAKRGLRH